MRQIAWRALFIAKFRAVVRFVCRCSLREAIAGIYILGIKSEGAFRITAKIERHSLA